MNGCYRLIPKDENDDMEFVEEEIFDGTYILDFQVAPFENDAAPSRPVLYKILETKKG